jgi:hypothetical protein
MRLRIASLIILCLFSVNGFAANYILTINGKNFDINMDEQQIIKLENQSTLRVTLSKKDIASYKVDNFAFDHPSRLSPSRTDLGHGIYQSMIVSPLGTLVLIQEYTTMDPSGLVDMMLNELTKEEAQYGYKITRSPVTKTLTDGSVLTGTLATSIYKDTENVRHVLCYKARDAGMLIITQYEKGIAPEEAQIIDLFWKTLNVTMR